MTVKTVNLSLENVNAKTVVLHDGLDSFLVSSQGCQALVARVPVENTTKVDCDHGADADALQPDSCMFTRGTNAELPLGDDHVTVFELRRH